jgi:hypothetical protein
MAVALTIGTSRRSTSATRKPFGNTVSKYPRYPVSELGESLEPLSPAAPGSTAKENEAKEANNRTATTDFIRLHMKEL